MHCACLWIWKIPNPISKIVNRSNETIVLNLSICKESDMAIQPNLPQVDLLYMDYSGKFLLSMGRICCVPDISL